MSLALGGRWAPRPTPWQRAAVNPGHAAYVMVGGGPGKEAPALAMTARRVAVSRASGPLSALARRVGASPLTPRVGAVAVLGFLGWRLGFGPSLHALAAIDGWSLGTAMALTALTTLCCAWRWSLVAAGLGATVPLPRAVAACYRSQFLNTATPGGVLGDVHRGVRHGRQHGDTGTGVRSVFWERTAGQVVQAAMALAVLTLLPSPVRPFLTGVWLTMAVVVCVLVGWLAARRSAGRPPSAWAARVLAECRHGLGVRRTWPWVALASALAVTGHVATFLVAARTAGTAAPTAQLVPLAFVVLVSMGVPLNVAGWGPREGVAAWAFGAAGLGAGAGLSTAVVYGVLVFAASLPGAVVLLAARSGRVGHAGRARRAQGARARDSAAVERARD